MKKEYEELTINTDKFIGMDYVPGCDVQTVVRARNKFRDKEAAKRYWNKNLAYLAYVEMLKYTGICEVIDPNYSLDDFDYIMLNTSDLAYLLRSFRGYFNDNITTFKGLTIEHNEKFSEPLLVKKGLFIVGELRVEIAKSENGTYDTLLHSQIAVTGDFKHNEEFFKDGYSPDPREFVGNIDKLAILGI